MALDISDAELDAARERGREIELNTPLAIDVRYDAGSGRIVIDFANRTTFLIPARLLQDLESASDEDLAEVELEFGSALRWDKLDVDFTIAGLLAGIFGTASYMAGKFTQSLPAAKRVISGEYL